MPKLPGSCKQYGGTQHHLSLPEERTKVAWEKTLVLAAPCFDLARAQITGTDDLAKFSPRQKALAAALPIELNRVIVYCPAALRGRADLPNGRDAITPRGIRVGQFVDVTEVAERDNFRFLHLAVDGPLGDVTDARRWTVVIPLPTPLGRGYEPATARRDRLLKSGDAAGEETARLGEHTDEGYHRGERTTAVHSVPRHRLHPSPLPPGANDPLIVECSSARAGVPKGMS